MATICSSTWFLLMTEGFTRKPLLRSTSSRMTAGLSPPWAATGTRATLPEEIWGHLAVLHGNGAYGVAPCAVDAAGAALVF